MADISHLSLVLHEKETALNSSSGLNALTLMSAKTIKRTSRAARRGNRRKGGSHELGLIIFINYTICFYMSAKHFISHSTA